MPDYINKIPFLLENLLFLVTICVSWIYRKNRELNPIRLSLIVGLAFIVWTMFIPRRGDGTDQRSILFNLSAFLDLCIMYYYFWRLMQNSVLRNILQGCFLILTSICLYFWISPRHGWKTFMPVLYGIQDLFYTIPCLLFIYEIFKSEEEVDPKTNPHFYIACGILFYSATTFPFHMTYKTLYDITPDILRALNSVQSLLSTITYLTFIKAFLCRSPEQKSSLS